MRHRLIQARVAKNIANQVFLSFCNRLRNLDLGPFDSPTKSHHQDEKIEIDFEENFSLASEKSGSNTPR